MQDDCADQGVRAGDARTARGPVARQAGKPSVERFIYKTEDRIS